MLTHCNWWWPLRLTGAVDVDTGQSPSFAGGNRSDQVITVGPSTTTRWGGGGLSTCWDGEAMLSRSSW